jgi:PAS domain S-box-containing protein
MSWDYTPYVLPLVLPGLMAGALALYAWRRARAEAMPFVALVASGALWCLGHAAELMGADLVTKHFWAKFQYFGIVVLPVAWLAIALQHSGKGRGIARRDLLLLMMVPTAGLALVWTNHLHGLIWRDMWLDARGPFSVLAVKHGPGYWVLTAYLYTLVAIGGLLLLLTVYCSPALYFRQRVALLLALAFPLLANVIYLSRKGPPLDLTSFAFAFSSMAIAYGILRYRLTEIVPLARDTIMENTPDTVIVLDRGNRVIDANPKAEKMIGASASDVVGRPVEEVFGDRPSLVASLAADSGTEVEFPLGPHENLRTYVVHQSVIQNRRGAAIGHLILFHDITERKRAEMEQRTLEDHMRHAQKLESLGILAGGIAHDFNNILLAIMGNADLALRDLSSDSPSRHSVEAIVKATRRAAGLTRQMLAYSGKGRFEVKVLDLNEAVKEMVSLLTFSISKKTALKTDLQRDLPAIKADPDQMQQVVMNLVTNAAEAIGEKEGGVVSLVTTTMHCDLEYLSRSRLIEACPEGGYVCLEVSDTGCGMDEETQERLFDPFFTTKTSGRGLGMSAILGIVRGHKGAIMVESKPGQGTTIRVLFPALDQPAVPAADEAAPQPAGAWRGQGTILLVDDEEDVRNLGTRMLRGMGFGVIRASDGQEAVELFSKHAEDIVCVILDISMPRMDGEETLHELRRRKSDIRAILTSGYSEYDLEERFSGSYVAAFLEKPYETSTLEEKLRCVLSK